MSHPFAAQRLTPGWFPFQPPPNLSISQVISRWRQAGWLGQIVGPHGSGKSTLAVGIVSQLSTEFTAWHWWTARPRIIASSDEGSPWSWIRCWCWCWPARFARVSAHSLASIDSPAELGIQSSAPEAAGQPAPSRQGLVIDGWEHLAVWQRWWYWRRFRRQFSAILLTTHRPVSGVAVIAETSPQRDVFHRLIARCLADKPEELPDQAPRKAANSNPWQPSVQQIDAAFDRHRGNFREAFFELYDLYESTRANATSPTP